ncbi:aminotransferase-like domain-containing protein [Fusibacter ferrireducens]|uniref:PLP-dependent aminotransferase family protein n=1 Tax=Fusibacter ferrireducens TaxID=2785058 RepID=A0ABR9ZQR0_9FIRM|nr:PLP-dependent aminotransferase family protein [Fusibacter ferrireducens]MBF4692478.1 PLP-dependent aminotransferase family protein [Fusibacter ferrireducens]
MYKYLEISQSIEQKIKLNKFEPGKRLPSIRSISKMFGCSMSTAIKAYEDLVDRHIVYAVPQSGYFVVEATMVAPERDLAQIDFSTGVPLIDEMPSDDFKHCLNSAVDIYSRVALHTDIEGIASLRRLLEKYLREYQIFSSYQNIFINLGIQQVLTILSQMPFPNNKECILIEEPTYALYIMFLKQAGIKTLTIKRDENGLDLKALEHLFKTGNIKFFYTVPRHHNPLGTCYSKKTREKIAMLAEKYDVYIVEDDYLAEMDFNVKYDPIYAYGDHYHHIYLKSFSKIIPWIRIGLCVMPSHLIDLFRTYKRNHYYYSYVASSIVAQATLEIYIRNGMINSHINLLKKQYSSKIKCLKSEIAKLSDLPDGCKWSYGSGYYAYIWLPEHLDESRLIDNLEKQNIVVSSGIHFYFSPTSYEKGIRICITRTNNEQIARGIALIMSEIEQSV